MLFTCFSFSKENNHDHSIATSFTIDKKGYLWRTYEKNGFLIVDYSKNFGINFSDPVSVNTIFQKIGTTGDARPKIVTNSKGNIFLTWTENLKKPYTGYIWFSSSINRGKSFSKPFIIHKDKNEITHRFDSLLIDKNDHIFVAWIDKRDMMLAKKANKNYFGASIYFSQSKDNGLSFSTEKKVTDNSCECCRISFTELKNNKLVLLWRHVYPGNIRDHAISFIDNNSITQSKQVTFSNWKVDACPHQGPALISDNDENLHISWFDGGKNLGLYYQKLNSKGDALLSPIKIGNYLSISDHSTLISVNKYLYIAWREINQESQKINVMISNDNGTTWDQPKILYVDQNTIDHPSLVNFNNNVYVGFNTRYNGFKLFKLK